jgi:hypothetical protein
LYLLSYPHLYPAPLATALPVPERTASEPGGAAGSRKPIELEFGPEPSIDDFQGPEPEI